jgi:hypothetical protein
MEKKKAKQLAQEQVDRDFQTGIAEFIANKKQEYLPERLDDAVHPYAVETAKQILGDMPFLQPNSIHAIHGLYLELEDLVDSGSISDEEKNIALQGYAEKAKKSTLLSQEVGLYDPFVHSSKPNASAFDRLMFEAADKRQREGFRKMHKDEQRMKMGQLTPSEAIIARLGLTDSRLIARTEKLHKEYKKRLARIEKLNRETPEELQYTEDIQTAHLGDGKVLTDNVSKALDNLTVKGIDARNPNSELFIKRVFSSAFSAPKALDYFGGSKERMIEAQERIAQLFSKVDTEEERTMDDESRQKARNARYYRGARQLKDLLKFSISGYDAQGLTFDDDSIVDRMNMKKINIAGSTSLALDDLIQFFPSIIDQNNEEDKKLMDSVSFYTNAKYYAGTKRNKLRDNDTQLGYLAQLSPKSWEQSASRQDFDILDAWWKANNTRARR